MVRTVKSLVADRERLVNQVRVEATNADGAWVEKVLVQTWPQDTPGKGAAGLLADLMRTAGELRPRNRSAV